LLGRFGTHASAQACSGENGSNVRHVEKAVRQKRRAWGLSAVRRRESVPQREGGRKMAKPKNPKTLTRIYATKPRGQTQEQTA
jgi:hypothetical protein